MEELFTNHYSLSSQMMLMLIKAKLIILCLEVLLNFLFLQQQLAKIKLNSISHKELGAKSSTLLRIPILALYLHQKELN
jgi:hypothetical protein